MPTRPNGPRWRLSACSPLSESTPPLLGAIEAGGTSIRCAVASTFDELLCATVHEFSTTTPQASLDLVAQFFQPFRDQGLLRTIGIASFGPLDRANFSIANTTPKQLWRNHHWQRELNARLGGVQVALEVDTTAAVVAEVRHGSAKGAHVAVYLTVGTGIGGGIAVNGSPLHGIVHPEIGHLLIGRAPGDTQKSLCPFHQDCLEGLISGPAIVERYGVQASQLDPDHEGLQLIAHYLGIACANVTTMIGAQRIVIGGGVMEAPALLQRVRQRTADLLGGYLPHTALQGTTVSTIVAPAFKHSGLIGAWLLAEQLR